MKKISKVITVFILIFMLNNACLLFAKDKDISNKSKNISYKKTNKKTTKKKAQEPIEYVYVCRGHDNDCYHNDQECPDLSHAPRIYKIDIKKVGNRDECSKCYSPDYREAKELVSDGVAEDYDHALEILGI